MATLFPPRTAYARTTYLGYRDGRPSRTAPGKFHLVRAGMETTDQRVITTVCGKTIDVQDEGTFVAPVIELRSRMLCKKCLGAMEARDV